MNRGPFIVFEGIDGAGTTTQSRLLAERLHRERPAVRVLLTAEPTAGPVGALIRQVLRERLVGKTLPGEQIPFDRRALALLFAADRLDHVACEVMPLVKAGWAVISDRYVLSSLAYQSLDAPLEWVETLNAFAPPPDILFFLECEPQVALARIRSSRAGGEVFETQETLTRVAAAYLDALPRVKAGRVVSLRAERQKEEVAQAVWREVEAFFHG